MRMTSSPVRGVAGRGVRLGVSAGLVAGCAFLTVGGPVVAAATNAGTPPLAALSA